MVDADDFDVEGLRALLRGEAPQQQPAATAPKTAAPKKAKARATKQASRTKKSGKR